MKQTIQNIAEKTAQMFALVFVLVGSFAIGFVGIGYPSFAQPIPTLPVFGGVIGEVIYCACSGGVIDVVGPPRPGAVYVMTPPSAVYMFYMNFVGGVWTLGDYIPGASMCEIFHGNGCSIVPSLGTVRQTGTSLEILPII